MQTIASIFESIWIRLMGWRSQGKHGPRGHTWGKTYKTPRGIRIIYEITTHDAYERERYRHEEQVDKLLAKERRESRA